jgi:hypothetical protein
MSKQLAQGIGANQAREDISKAIQAAGPNPTLRITGHTAYAPGVKGYAQDAFTTFLSLGYVGNTAQSVVGGYILYWTINAIDPVNHTATVHFHAVNTSNLQSASRLPWNRSRSLFSNSPFGPHGPVGTIIQRFDWDATIHY